MQMWLCECGAGYESVGEASVAKTCIAAPLHCTCCSRSFSGQCCEAGTLGFTSVFRVCIKHRIGMVNSVGYKREQLEVDRLLRIVYFNVVRVPECVCSV